MKIMCFIMWYTSSLILHMYLHYPGLANILQSVIGLYKKLNLVKTKKLKGQIS